MTTLEALLGINHAPTLGQPTLSINPDEKYCGHDDSFIDRDEDGEYVCFHPDHDGTRGWTHIQS